MHSLGSYLYAVMEQELEKCALTAWKKTPARVSGYVHNLVEGTTPKWPGERAPLDAANMQQLAHVGSSPSVLMEQTTRGSISTTPAILRSLGSKAYKDIPADVAKDAIPARVVAKELARPHNRVLGTNPFGHLVGSDAGHLQRAYNEPVDDLNKTIAKRVVNPHNPITGEPEGIWGHNERKKQQLDYKKTPAGKRYVTKPLPLP